MREYLNKKLIVETLKTHSELAFTVRELAAITEIPIATLRSNLKHLVHDGAIQKKTVTQKVWNKKGTKKVDHAQVWYYI